MTLLKTGTYTHSMAHYSRASCIAVFFMAAAALVGGIDSPFGAVLGGFLVGVLENLIGAYVVGTELKLTVALVLIIGVLVFKPTGLFGRVFVSRV